MPKFNKDVPEKFFNDYIAKRNNRYIHLCSLLNQALKADYLLLAGLNLQQNIAETSLVFHSGEIINNFTYSLEDTPCADVQAGIRCLIVDEVTKQFPKDLLLSQMGALAYLGLPIHCEGKIVGLVVALSNSTADLFYQNHFVAELFVEQLGAELSSEWRKLINDSDHQLLDEVCNLSSIGVWEYNVSRNKLYWSNEVYNIYGIPNHTVVTPELGISFYSDEDKGKITTLFNLAVNNGTPYQADFQFTDAKGIKKWVRTSGKVEYDKNGKPCRVFGAIEDVTNDMELLQKEQQQHQYLKGVLNSLSDAVLTIDSKGFIIDCNKASELLFGYKIHELEGLKINELMPDSYASQHDSYMKHYQKTGEAKIIGIGRQLPAKRKSGEIFQMELSLCEYRYDEKVVYIGIVRDITAQLQANESIYKLAFTDTTTGLKNKASFDKAFHRLHVNSKDSRSFLYAAYLDIDGLAKLNMAYGIDQANILIAKIFQRLEKAIGTGFSIYKYTADEFIVISSKPINATYIANFDYLALEEIIRNPDIYRVYLRGQVVSVNVSIASMIAPLALLKQETLLDYLEYAMRQAKKQKPSGYFFLTTSALEAYDRAKQIKDTINTAIEQNEFFIVLQPQFRNKENLSSSEALVRWNSKELGFVSPAEFIPLAEENDQIILLGDWVIERVCQIINMMSEDGIKSRIAINISSKQIVQPDFESKLIATTSRYNVSPDLLMLELTESVLVSDLQLVKTKMLFLASLGFLFSVDDFGTGYSSLNYIRELPITELKIDKCFIDGIGKDDSHSATNIVNAIIDMAKALHLQVVAEGVETQEQYDYLKKRGCDIVQGYLLSRPLSLVHWQEFLSCSYYKRIENPLYIDSNIL